MSLPLQSIGIFSVIMFSGAVLMVSNGVDAQFLDMMEAYQHAANTHTEALFGSMTRVPCADGSGYC